MLNRRLSSTYASGSMGAPEQSLPQEGVSPRKQCQPARRGGQAHNCIASIRHCKPASLVGEPRHRHTLHPQPAGTMQHSVSRPQIKQPLLTLGQVSGELRDAHPPQRRHDGEQQEDKKALPQAADGVDHKQIQVLLQLRPRLPAQGVWWLGGWVVGWLGGWAVGRLGGG